MVSDVGLVCILLGGYTFLQSGMKGYKAARLSHKGLLDDINVIPKAFLIATNKLYDCKTILSHTVNKYLKFSPSYFTILCLFYFSFF